MWFLIFLGWFKNITVQFLIAGHTKFSPDRMFGWISQKLRSHDLVNFQAFLSAIGTKKRKIAVYECCDGRDIAGQNWDRLFDQYFTKKASIGITRFHVFTFAASEGTTAVRARRKRWGPESKEHKFEGNFLLGPVPSAFTPRLRAKTPPTEDMKRDATKLAKITGADLDYAEPEVPKKRQRTKGAGEGEE